MALPKAVCGPLRGRHSATAFPTQTACRVAMAGLVCSPTKRIHTSGPRHTPPSAPPCYNTTERIRCACRRVADCVVLHAPCPCANYGSCMARPTIDIAACMCELRVMHGRPTIDIAACSPTRPHGAKCMRPSPGRLNSASVCPECMHPPRPTHAWPVSQPLEIEREISRERARSLQPAATRDSCGGRRARPTQS